MTIITGTAKQFINMFKTMACGDKYPLFDVVIIEIKNDLIVINTVDKSRAVATHQEYEGFIIDGDENIPINIGEINGAMKLFNSDDLVKFEYINDKVILSLDLVDKKDTIIIPCQPINCKISPIEFGDDSICINGDAMNFDAHVIVDAKIMQNQIKRANYINSTYHEYIINIDNNNLLLTVGDINDFELSSSIEVNVEGHGLATSRYMHGYDDIFRVLDGDVELYMSNDKPMLIIKNDDKYTVKYLIAPVIDG